MEIRKCIFTKNDCYKAGRTITPKGIMVHSTGANNPNLRRYVQPDDGILGKNVNNNDWNRGGLDVCVHGFIGKDKDGKVRVYQTLPWDRRGWHAGGAANNTHISFEICEDDLKSRTYFNEIYSAAVELCAYLCRRYGLTEKDVICHSEGHAMGIASNHGDVMHWFPKHGKDMDDFRADVKKKLSGNADKPEKEEAPGKKPESRPVFGEGTLVIDGIIGKNTVYALQKYLKTTPDGYIDGQYPEYKRYWESIDNAVCRWDKGSSQMVYALQRLTGAETDGILGKNTARALQNYLIKNGYPCGQYGSDGYFGTESAKALQRFLNGR